MKGVTLFLAELRASHPDMVALFTRGRCYSLFLIMRRVWPQAEAYYSEEEGHVYVKISGAFFDIRGRHFSVPKDLVRLNHRGRDKPHRWGKRDSRRLTA